MTANGACFSISGNASPTQPFWAPLCPREASRCGDNVAETLNASANLTLTRTLNLTRTLTLTGTAIAASSHGDAAGGNAENG